MKLHSFASLVAVLSAVAVGACATTASHKQTRIFVDSLYQWAYCHSVREHHALASNPGITCDPGVPPEGTPPPKPPPDFP